MFSITCEGGANGQLNAAPQDEARSPPPCGSAKTKDTFIGIGLRSSPTPHRWLSAWRFGQVYDLSGGCGFRRRGQGGTHGLSLDSVGELSKESAGESWKLSSQSLPRIAAPAGKRSMASRSRLVESGVVTLE